MNEAVVVGGGITGIQAALDLAGHGVRVRLIEREPSIGGHMAMLDKTFPTNDCSMCILSPKMVEVERHPLITLHTCTEVVGIEGEVGDFTVRLRRHPRYVDEERCNGCGDCTDVCPVEVYNRFDAGIGVRKAIYRPMPQSVPNITIRDAEHCIDCGLCYDACGRDAVLHDDEDGEEESTVRAAAVVITTGYATFDPAKKGNLRYLNIPDVITSLEFERMINASGPTGGALRRLSDGRVPRSVVFLQCVGSRDMQVDRPYCSCVCCMAAMKNAMLIREHHPETEVTVLYMDIRAYGKGYEEYYNRAVDMGVRFVRGLPGEILRNDSGIEMQVEDTETAEVTTLRPDLVVLSVGMEPPVGAAEVAERFGISLEKTGFVHTLDEKTNTVATIRPGIYVAGTVVAPKDIPDCVAMGGAAAMRAYTDVLRAQE
ncbi:CoB--CoM heterodisulfide reductase iron-sulfur subunit A family protein [Methanofollis fontis]|uniref:CoB--CoM heterodisulfide reductase iron-sulfur subunit A n=1 Tax=Methanofollis fontis TaxID=2052832 RepID=A0A483CX40_9EURY|nr:CoB--CoM heterodisulfide reductase iron-sulfur subunit A family protein [Methanofollis fontis]TAJ43652.1 4Fe-4S ferredoxin [Methanofollis fontis]